MKKILALVLALTLLFTLCMLTACVSKDEPDPLPDDDPAVVDPVDPTDDEEDELNYDITEVWHSLTGYWVAEDGYSAGYFVGFFSEGGEFQFEYGLLYSEFWRCGAVIGDEPVGVNIFRITVYFAAEEGNEWFDARDEEMLTFYLNTSETDNGIVKTSADDYPAYEWTSYTFFDTSLFPGEG